MAEGLPTGPGEETARDYLEVYTGAPQDLFHPRIRMPHPREKAEGGAQMPLKQSPQLYFCQMVAVITHCQDGWDGSGDH